MDKDKYISTLSECLLGTLLDQQLCPKNIIFQQNNFNFFSKIRLCNKILILYFKKILKHFFKFQLFIS